MYGSDITCFEQLLISMATFDKQQRTVFVSCLIFLSCFIIKPITLNRLIIPPKYPPAHGISHICMPFDMGTSSRKLELTVLSGENLCIDRKPVTKSAYVVVQTECIGNSFTTRMATEDGRYPAWNESFLMDMPMHASSIMFEVKCKTWTGIQTVGTARVQVSEFLGGFVPESYLHFLSYRLRDREGRPNGIINFSVRVKTPEYTSSVPVPVPVSGTVVSEMNSGGFHVTVPLGQDDKKNNSGVIMGVPVSWNYSSGLAKNI